MKKTVILSLGLVLAGAVAFGQNNQSTVTQESLNGATNVATVNQQGSDNVLEGVQLIEGPTLTPVNDLNVKQNGAGNGATVDQYLKTFGGTPDNKIVVDQKGSGNAADVTTNAMWGHDVKVVQDGKKNSADVNVERNGVKATVYQVDGAKNGVAVQDIKAVSSEAYIKQSGGNGNMATQYMPAPAAGDPMGSGNLFKIMQTDGNGNAAKQEFIPGGHFESMDNEIVIQQIGGSGNLATQNLGAWVGDRGPEISSRNYAKTVQDGGSGNVALVEQLKDDNQAYQTQTGGNGNYAEIKQISYGTTFAWSQQIQKGAGGNKAWAHVYNGGGTSKQYQDGKNNESKIKQAGNRNTIESKQVGKGNISFEQTSGGGSNDNLLMVNQDGNYNDAWIQITGSMNDAKIMQTGGHHAGTITQIGDNNIVNVTQSN